MSAIQSPLKKYDYYKGPESLGALWTLKRDPLTMTCALFTHAHGWEIRLTAGANFRRTQICKGEGDVFRTSDTWKEEAKRQGWTE